MRADNVLQLFATMYWSYKLDGTYIVPEPPAESGELLNAFELLNCATELLNIYNDVNIVHP